jgi:hypothetical protein
MASEACPTTEACTTMEACTTTAFSTATAIRASRHALKAPPRTNTRSGAPRQAPLTLRVKVAPSAGAPPHVQATAGPAPTT